MVTRRLAHRPRNHSHGEVLPAPEPIPHRLLPRVLLLANRRIAPYRLALAAKAGHTICRRPAVLDERWLSWRAELLEWTTSGTSDDKGRHASDAKLASSKNHP